MDSCSTVKWREQPDPSLLALLETVEFGGRGLRYRRKSVAKTLDQAGPTRYLHIDDKDTVVAAYALTQTSARLAGAEISASYRGLLAVNTAYRRRGYGRRLVAAAFDQQTREYGSEPGLSFGLIEAANEGSLRLLEAMGARDAGRIESRLIYRQWPRPSPGLRLLDEADLTAYRQCLHDGETGGGLVLRASKRLPAFGLFADGGLVAAARIGLATIDLGPGGPVANFLHRYGYARFNALGKRYNRRALRYLTIHDPVVSSDPAKWQSFLHALLAYHQVHMALFTLDPDSDMSAAMKETGIFGRFSQATRSELRVLVNAWNLDDGWLDRVRSKPVSGGPVY
jgi:ribosomal protein S18 acetylase RimI-like enzyme